MDFFRILYFVLFKNIYILFCFQEHLFEKEIILSSLSLLINLTSLLNKSNITIWLKKKTYYQIRPEYEFIYNYNFFFFNTDK